MELALLEDSLNTLLTGIGTSSSDEEKMVFSDQIDQLLKQELSNPEVKEYGFDSVRKMAICLRKTIASGCLIGTFH